MVASCTRQQVYDPPLGEAYRRMLAAQGHQKWWPGRTQFEVCLGAILTQNTAWTHVERAIARLHAADALHPRAILELPEPDLAELIRPAGCFNVKARRLRSFVTVLMEQYGGNLDRLFCGDTPTVRNRLLAIHGTGPETADCMLLYAGRHLSFVVDAYTRRIFSRHGWCSEDASYHQLQELCARSFPPRMDHDSAETLDAWQDFHAQLVRVGKDFCRSREPRCELCPLRPLLPPNGASTRTTQPPAHRS